MRKVNEMTYGLEAVFEQCSKIGAAVELRRRLETKSNLYETMKLYVHE